MPKLALLTAYGGPIELAEFPLTTPAPGTALKLRMAGICGFDMHIFRGELPLPCPYAMGDEAVAPLNCALAQVLSALRDVNDAFASAGAELVPRRALVP
jgi:hypothetical protein